MSNIEDITQEDFSVYEEVQQEGLVNMWSPQVEDFANISKEVHLAIIEHYEELCARWPAIRNLEED